MNAPAAPPDDERRAPPCNADFDLVAAHYACPPGERDEMHTAYLADPAAAAVCFATLAAEIRDRLALGAPCAI